MRIRGIRKKTEEKIVSILLVRNRISKIRRRTTGYGPVGTECSFSEPQITTVI